MAAAGPARRADAGLAGVGRPDAADDPRIRQAAGRWKGFSLADWNAASSGKPWFGSDGLHLNSAGAFALSGLLREKVLGLT